MLFITRKIIRNNILSNPSRYICKNTNKCGKYTGNISGNIVGNKRNEDRQKEINKLYKKTEEEKNTETVLYCMSGFALACSLSMGPGMFLASMYGFLNAGETTHKRNQNMLKIAHLSQSLNKKSNTEKGLKQYKKDNN